MTTDQPEPYESPRIFNLAELLKDAAARTTPPTVPAEPPGPAFSELAARDLEALDQFASWSAIQQLRLAQRTIPLLVRAYRERQQLLLVTNPPPAMAAWVQSGIAAVEQANRERDEAVRLRRLAQHAIDVARQDLAGIAALVHQIEDQLEAIPAEPLPDGWKARRCNQCGTEDWPGWEDDRCPHHANPIGASCDGTLEAQS